VKGNVMKKLISTIAAIPMLLASLNAMAGTATITSNANNPNPALAALAKVPQQLLGILVDQGVRPKDLGNGKFSITAKNIHCDFRSRGAVEDVTGGIASEVCRLNSENVKDSRRGQRLGDSRALVDSLREIEDASIGGTYTDCAMGYCGTFVKSLSCLIDTNIGEFLAGRFACTLVDEF
jgi:hypothetical protein